MKIQSQKAKEIDAYLAKLTDPEVGKWPVEISGEKRRLPFYRFPIELLYYNVNNGRLAMDRYEWEKSNKRELDASQPTDITIIRDMLLSLDPAKTESLKKDLHQKGQMEPGVITHDGVVINGNRRMAVFALLHEEEPTGKWCYLEAVRLPPDISEADLWKIEAGLQLSKDKVAEYHPVNELLKMREGIERGLSPEEVAAAMYGRTADEVQEALRRLKLIDYFLEFIGQPGNYGFIRKYRFHEYFIDIQKRVIAQAERAGLSKRDINRRLQYTFALMRASALLQGSARGKIRRITHWDIRKLDNVFSDAHACDTFIAKLEDKKPKDMCKVSGEDLIENFREALDILEMKKDRNKPVRLIEKAIKALESIDSESIDKYRDPLIAQQIARSIARLSELVQGIQTKITG